MMDIDTALRRLAEEREPSRLSLVDAAVLEHIEGRTIGAPRMATPFPVLAVAAALVMGLAAGLVPGEAPQAQHTLAEISGAAEFAPSTLLVGAL